MNEWIVQLAAYTLIFQTVQCVILFRESSDDLNAFSDVSEGFLSQFIVS